MLVGFPLQGVHQFDSPRPSNMSTRLFVAVSVHHMNRIGTGSSYSKLWKLDYLVSQTGWSSFVNSDSSQGHR
jgi:hypothetical protein